METQLGMAHTIPRRRNTRMDFHIQDEITKKNEVKINGYNYNKQFD